MGGGEGWLHGQGQGQGQGQGHLPRLKGRKGSWGWVGSSRVSRYQVGTTRVIPMGAVYR